jgi:predicted glutamine amidotransferase
MCGLVGFITNYRNGFFVSDVTAFQQLLFFDVLRGGDATGVTLINVNGETETFKENSSSPVFMSRPEVKSFLSRANVKGMALLGHNRKSTIGKDVDENAHPFVIDKRFVFFHNGTLREHRKLADVEVDSEALGIHLTRCEGEKTKLEEALEKVNGAYACVWYDQHKHTVYFLRNHERPLAVATLDNNGGFAYASEGWMLRGLLSRNNQKIKELVEIATETLYKIDLDKTPLVLEKEELTVKKPLPPTRNFTSSGGRVTDATEQVMVKPSDPLTKREADQMSQFLPAGEKIEWMIDDYVERNIDTTGRSPRRNVVTDYIVWGTNDTYPGVIFRGVFNNVSLDQLLAIADAPIYAEICYSEYDRKLKALMVVCRSLTSVKQDETPITH